MNYFIRELEMEEQLKLDQKDRDATGTDAQSDVMEDVPAENRPSASGMILTIQHNADGELTAEAQKSRLAKAEAVYGAIAEITEPAENQDISVSRRA